MDKDFKINLDWDKLTPEELSLYIYELHSHLVSFQTSSIKQLIVSLDRLSQKICDDIDAIADNDVWFEFEEFNNETQKIEVKQKSKLTILSDSKDDKVFDRIVNLISKIESFKKVSDMAEALRPEVAERKEELKKSKAIQIDLKGGNVFESILKSQTSK